MLGGYSDDVQRRIKELRASQLLIVTSGHLTPELAKLFREDFAKLDQALSAADKGDLDVGDLTGAEISARRIMWEIEEKTKDPRFAADKRPQGGDIDAAFPTMSAIDREAKAASKEAAAAVAAVPVEYKVAGAVALVVVLALLIKL